MGGHISVGVRRADGSFRTVGGWTNPLKGHVLDDRFMLDGSLSPIDEYIDRHGEDSSEGNVPGEYGYVLIDAVENLVVNWTHYDNLGL